MSDLRRVNRDLKREFGIAPGDALGRAHFRMAMTNQIETRIGKVANFTESGIYRNETVGAQKVPKYNFAGHFDVPKWALERLMFFPLEEVPESAHGSYEPVHVFPHINGLCQLPPFESIKLAVYLLLYGPRKTLGMYVDEERLKFKKEVETGVDILNDQQSYMQGQLQGGEATKMPSNYEGDSPLLKQALAPIPTETKR